MVLHLDFSIVPVSEDISALEQDFHQVINTRIISFAKSVYGSHFEGLSLSDTGKASTILADILDYISSKQLPRMYLIIDERTIISQINSLQEIMIRFMNV